MGGIASAAVILLALALALAILAACATPATPTATPSPTTAAVPTERPAGTTPAAPPSPAVTPPTAATSRATATLSAALPTISRPPTTSSATPRAEPSPSAADVGYLEGRATVGPLTPLERVGVPTRTPSPETCTSRGLAIYDAAGDTAVTSFRFRPDCTYRIALAPGSYVVRLDPQPRIGGSRDLPRTVAIESGKTIRLDLDIDTGIR